MLNNHFLLEFVTNSAVILQNQLKFSHFTFKLCYFSDLKEANIESYNFLSKSKRARRVFYVQLSDSAPKSNVDSMDITRSTDFITPDVPQQLNYSFNLEK